jgi:uncharacterized delta-60 repeat protein
MLLASLFRGFADHFRRVALGLTVTTATIFAQSNTPSALDGFDPNVDGNIYAVATQPDGKILLAGQFQRVVLRSGELSDRLNFARVNVDGTLDESFTVNTDGPVRAVLVQPDNNILIGGDFTKITDASGTSTTRNRVARITPAGNVDSFNPNISGSILPQVYALVLQADGSVVVGGRFSTVQANGAATSTVRNNIARFNSAGVLDANYNPNPNGIVLALALHANNQILVGGGFTSFTAGNGATTARLRVARLKSDGTVDAGFDPEANNGVTSIAVQHDGKVVLGGYFTSLQPNAGDTTTCNHIVRLNLDGTVDSNFNASIVGNVLSVAVAPDGGILAGGHFVQAWGRGGVLTARNYVARFLTDGTLDSLNPGVNYDVDAFAFQSDGQIVMGGYFTRVQTVDAANGTVRNHVARFYPSGALDAAFQLDAGGRVLASVVQKDGKTVIGGTFTNAGGATHNYLARLNADGSVDTTYTAVVNGRISTLAYQSADDKVIIGGAFTTVTDASGTTTRNHIARLDGAGKLDTSFDPNLDNEVGAIALQSDGKIIVGGLFGQAQPNGTTTAVTAAHLVRLQKDGTVDSSFQAFTNNAVSAIALQSDGRILLGGAFTTIQQGISGAPVVRGHLARLLGDGTVDTAYNPGPTAQVSAIVAQSDGKAIVGGSFNGFVPVGATVVTVRNFIARINNDGTVDANYDPNVTGTVIALAQQTDGNTLVGGAFTGLMPAGDTTGTAIHYLVRLTAAGKIDPSLNLNFDEQTGNRVDSITITPDGKNFLVGGTFTSLRRADTGTRVTRNHFARVSLTGNVDLTFDPSNGGQSGGTINAIAVQADGKVLVGGAFRDVGGAKTVNIARFNPEGTADSSFNPTLAPDGPVNTIAVRPTSTAVSSQLRGFAWVAANGALRSTFRPTAKISGEIKAAVVQKDGLVVIGGSFTDLSGVAPSNLARFKADGTLDDSFKPNVNGTVSALALQADGALVIAGNFTTVNGTTRNHIARLLSGGALDSYDPNANAHVDALALQSDGSLIVGGAFTTFTQSGTVTTRSYLARLASSGALDATYNPNPNGAVVALALQAGDVLVAAGSFSSVQPNSGTALTRNSVARFDKAGLADPNFDPNPNGAVTALASLSDGRIILGGLFTSLTPTLNGTASTAVARNYLARVGTNGAVDANFNLNLNGAVSTISVGSADSLVIGGSFTTVQPTGTSAALGRNHLVRVDVSGAVDPNFNPDVAGTIDTVAALSDGSVLVGGLFEGLQANAIVAIGGSFNSIGGVAAKGLALLSVDGAVNGSFTPNPNGAVYAVVPQLDGKFVAGGAFTTIANATRNGLARFNADGTLDTAYNPNPGFNVRVLALQSDGKILAGGLGNGTSASTVGNGRMIRLNTDGSIDPTFAPPTSGPVLALALQADGRILVITNETSTVTRNVLQRLNANGTFDSTFAPANLAASLNTVAVQSDGRILLGGNFSYGSPAVSNLVRLNSNGTVDQSFNPAPNGAVTVVAPQADGRVLLGGSFTSVGGVQRVSLARLASTAPANEMLGVSSDRRTILWVRGGPAGEIAAATFEQSSDKQTWTSLGQATRVTGTSIWQLNNQSLSASTTFYIRARGIAPGDGGTSSGIFESVREFNYASAAYAPPVAGSGTPRIPESFYLDPFGGLIVGMLPSSIVITPVDPIAITPVIPSGPASDQVVSDSAVLDQLVAAAGTPSTTARFTNISVRARVTTANPLIVGFAIRGTSSRTVLLRGVGRGLTKFGVTDTMIAPVLDLYDAKSNRLLESAGLFGSALSKAFLMTGAFPLEAGNADSAVLITLAPGSYTVQVSDGSTTSTGGVALLEIYDVTGAATSRLTNVSSRASVASGSGALISGFVVSGTGSERVLVRGVGPALTKFGVSGVLVDPSLTINDTAGRVVGTNDNWWTSSDPIIPELDVAALNSSAAASVGAFALDAGSKDAARVVGLTAGAYTVQVNGAGGSAGAAVVEAYELP